MPVKGVVMLDSPHFSVSALIKARQPGYTMPAGLYTRPEVFEADMEAIFHRQWLLVGACGDVAEPGDVYVLDIGRSTILILRDDDDVIRAYHNICRHRGARILPAGKHTVGKLVCPYHQWTYELTGELVSAPHMGMDFDKTCRDLKPVHVRTVAGLVYVSLADTPPADFDALEQEIAPRLAPYQLDQAKVAFETEIVETGNWKLTMENNRECYHCEANHPELCLSFTALDFGFDPEELSPETRAEAAANQAMHAARTEAWEAEGFGSRCVAQTGPETETNFRSERLVIANNGLSQTMDGALACKRLLGEHGRTDLGDVHLWGFNSWTHVMPDYAVIITAFPLDADRTLVRSKWLVHPDAVEGFDYTPDRLSEVWVRTNEEDAELVARAHSGAQSSGYTPGPYSRFTETELSDFTDWYVQRIVEAGY